ncbi:hypothetical protein GIB67_020696 [Kingdonia uniflora]|uniref:RRM domain-containing protein n=1 Tax=Kingdonia uniflora TaxID=39325 RepID=A0A7J7NK67_9MAGN|nr:hypothetical protein GIB67_020696 [Kingdonia uniflora]
MLCFSLLGSICEAMNKLLGIASTPLDEQTEARSTINGLKPLKKLGYRDIMGFGSSPILEALKRNEALNGGGEGSDDADYNSTWFQPYSVSQMIQMIILLITGTNKDGGYQIRLSFYTSEKTLHAAFEGFGELVEVKIIMDRISKRSKDYAFLMYTIKEAAGATMKEMNGKIINGWIIVVDVAQTSPPKYNKDSLMKPTV